MWTDEKNEKAKVARVREEKRREEKRQEDQRRQCEEKEDAGAPKSTKVANHLKSMYITWKKVMGSDMFGPLLAFQMPFRMTGATDCAPCHK